MKDVQFWDGDLILARGQPTPVFPFLVVVGDILEPTGVPVCSEVQVLPGATIARADVPTETEPVGGHAGLPNVIILRSDEDWGHARLGAKRRTDKIVCGICQFQGRINILLPYRGERPAGIVQMA